MFSVVLSLFNQYLYLFLSRLMTIFIYPGFFRCVVFIIFRPRPRLVVSPRWHMLAGFPRLSAHTSWSFRCWWWEFLALDSLRTFWEIAEWINFWFWTAELLLIDALKVPLIPAAASTCNLTVISENHPSLLWLVLEKFTMQIAIITYSNDYLKTNVSFKSFPFEFVLSNQHVELEMLKVNRKREIRLPAPPPHTLDVCPRCYGNMSACFSSLV